MKRLCLNMIVRNESERIERCLNSLVGQIDCAVILDTMSDDDTVERIEAFCDAHGIPVEIYFGEFENFSSARNRALNYAQNSMMEFDYVLFADADMELHADDKKFQQLLETALPAFAIEQRAGVLRYMNTRLLRKDVRAQYVGATHEYLDVQAMPLSSDIVWYEDHADGANRKDKFERDIALLKDDLSKNPTNERAWFYLAQSYREAGDYANAREAYMKRVLLGGWDEEVWYAQRMIGACNLKLSYEAGFIEETLAAYNRRPQRLEPLYDLAKFFREKGDNALAALFANAGRGRPVPSDLLFVDEYAHKFGLDEEFSIAGFYLPDHRDEAFEVCNRLALDNNAPAATRHLARANLLHYVQPLRAAAPSFKGYQIPFAPPRGFVPMNPSVTRHGDQMWTTVRCVNYTITPEGYYAIRGDDGSITTDNPINTVNYLLRLNNELVPLEAKPIITPKLPVVYSLVRGWEDMRLYTIRGELGVVANVREANADGWCEQHTGIIENNEVRRPRYVRPQGVPHNHEKNWMPISNGDFMYKVGHIVDQNGVTVAVNDPPFHSADLRGGSQLIVFRGGSLALVHEAHYGFDGKRMYTHRFIYFDSEGRPLRASLPFVFHDKQIEFAAGMCWHFDGRRLVISYGVRDREAWIATVDAHDVAEMVGLI